MAARMAAITGVEVALSVQ
jgi:hypothetical protein